MQECNIWQELMHEFRKSCENFDHLWIKRRRSFDTFSMISILLNLCGGRNNTYLKALHNGTIDNGLVPAASSFCVSRRKMPSHIISEVRKDLVDCWSDIGPQQPDWFGFTPHAVDGSRINLPSNLVKSGYRLPYGSDIPQGLLTVLIRTRDRIISDLRLTSDLNERTQAQILMENLSHKDLIIYDRGFLSFALLTEHVARRIGGVFRVAKECTFREIEENWDDEIMDQIIEIDPTQPTYRNAQRCCPDIEIRPIKLRIIKYKIQGKTYVLASTILDQRIPPEAFKNLYKERWVVEEFFKIFKQTQNAEFYHTSTENGVEQEVEASALLWNVSRFVDSIAHFKKSTHLLKNITLSG